MLVHEKNDADGHYFRHWRRTKAVTPDWIPTPQEQLQIHELVAAGVMESVARDAVRMNWTHTTQPIQVLDVMPSSQGGATRGVAKLLFLPEYVLLYVHAAKQKQEIAAHILATFHQTFPELDALKELLVQQQTLVGQLLASCLERYLGEVVLKSPTAALHTFCDPRDEQVQHYHVASIKAKIICRSGEPLYIQQMGQYEQRALPVLVELKSVLQAVVGRG